jgi:hypothetical protein
MLKLDQEPIGFPRSRNANGGNGEHQIVFRGLPPFRRGKRELTPAPTVMPGCPPVAKGQNGWGMSRSGAYRLFRRTHGPNIGNFRPDGGVDGGSPVPTGRPEGTSFP